MAKLEKATYWQRILAWIIDIIIIMIITGFITGDWRAQTLFDLNKYLLIGAISFIYWTIPESINGQSPGKILLRIKVVGIKGDKIDIKKSAIQSFGKSFILPIDIVIGLIIRPYERLRVFNILSETTVIKQNDENQKPVKKKKR